MTTPAISNLIREGKGYQITSSMQAGRELGMHTMDQHLADLVDDGQITRDAAFEKAHDPETLDAPHQPDGCPAAGHQLQRRGHVRLRRERTSLMSMAVKSWSYTSRNQSGKVVKGKLEAPSEAAALGKLQSMGLSPLTVAEGKAGRPATWRSASRASRRASTSSRSRS